MERDPGQSFGEQDPTPRRDWRVEDGSLYKSPYSATLRLTVPVGTNIELHPAALSYINESFDGRCPISMKRPFGKNSPLPGLYISFFVEEDTSDIRAALEVAAKDISTQFGLPDETLTEITITDAREQPEAPLQSGLRLVPPASD